jgi:hypothetical protein
VIRGADVLFAAVPAEKEVDDSKSRMTAPVRRGKKWEQATAIAAAA